MSTCIGRKRKTRLRSCRLISVTKQILAGGRIKNPLHLRMERVLAVHRRKLHFQSQRIEHYSGLISQIGVFDYIVKKYAGVSLVNKVKRGLKKIKRKLIG